MTSILVELIHVLRLISLLAPNVPLARRTANEWFDSGSVSKLINRGWLNTDESGNVLIHPVISATLRTVFNPEPENASRLINQLSNALGESRGKGVEAQNKLLPHAVSVAKALKGTETNDFAWLLDRIAVIMRETADYNRALIYGEQAVATVEKVNGTEHLDTAATYNNIALVYKAKGDYDKAMEYYEKALAIREKVLGTEHPSTAVTYNNIALLYQDKGDYDKALEYSKKDLAISEAVLDPNHPDTRITHRTIAGIYSAMGNTEKAQEYYLKAKGLLG